MSAHTHNFEFVNPDTGEIHTMTALANKKDRSPFSSFTILNVDLFQYFGKMVHEKKLKPTDIFILAEVMASTGNNNDGEAIASVLAKSTGLDISNVSKSLGRLVKHGMLATGKKYGRVQTFKISAKLAWKGKAAGHRPAIKDETDKRVSDQIKRDKTKLELVK